MNPGNEPEDRDVEAAFDDPAFDEVRALLADARETGPVPDDPAKPAAWNRGRYLVDALGHCAECHSPRTQLGGLDSDRYLAGNPQGPDNDKVPGITSSKAKGKGIGGWSDGDLALFLEAGLTPDGDVAGGAMGEVVRNTTSKLTADDRAAIVTYLRTVPAKE